MALKQFTPFAGLLLVLVMALPLSEAKAQVFCSGGDGTCVNDYGLGFQQGMSRNVLPGILEATAGGASLNAIQAMPMPPRVPETAAFGFQFAGAGERVNTPNDSSNQFLHENAAASYENWPLSVDVFGGSLASSLYLVLPADVFGLSSKDMIGFHGSLHGLSLEDSEEFDLADPVQSTLSGRYASRTAALGLRYSSELVGLRGARYASFDGLRVVSGVTYMYQASSVRTGYDSLEFYHTPSLADGLQGPDISTLARSRKFLEYQTVLGSESRNFVIPVELRTGFTLGFLTISIGPGVAFNYGKHKVDAELNGTVCSSLIGTCSNAESQLDVYKALAPDAAADIQTAFDIGRSTEPAFFASETDTVYSRAFIPYMAADIRLNFGLNLVFSAGVSRDAGRGAFAVEVEF